MRSRSLLAVALALAAAALTVTPALAIKGGTESAEPYSFLGSLQRPESPRADGHVCGVMLVAPRWALSASHCARVPNLAGNGVPRGWTVRIGSLDTTSGGEVAQVDKFYRLATEQTGFFGRDLSLLHLRTPVHAEPARLATATPADGTPARILGWGMTCADMGNPDCLPSRLREADTVVQPIALCPPAIPGAELCVGAPDGSVAAANMDSGGPALIDDGHGWTVAGVLSGGDDDIPSMYTDLTKHLDWIEGIVTGTDVPPDVAMPSLEGVVGLGDCTGSVVRTPDASPADPALLLTNGHCVEGERPAPGSALVDRPANRVLSVADREGYPAITVTATRLVYATMTGTDVALYRLDKTYAELPKVFTLATEPARAGDRVDVLGTARRQSCTVEDVVPHLREGAYDLAGSTRMTNTDSCFLGGGDSGSAMLSEDGNTVVAVHNTSNRDGERCTDDNPCEVAEDGTVTAVRGRAYGQQVAAIPGCVVEGSVLDLDRPGCVLTRPVR